MAGTVHVFDFLSAPAPKFGPMVVLFGDEPFLKQLALKKLRKAVITDEDTPFATFEGDTAEWRTVADELSTVSLFGGGGPRLVIVTDADKFVTEHREDLEAYVGKAKTTGLLVLGVSTWAANTRLYKAVDQRGLQIECRAPQRAAGKSKAVDEGRVAKWLAVRAAEVHDAKLAPKAATQLLELVGVEFGLLDQELAKLALFAGPGGQVTEEMVRDVVGGWRTKTVWDMLDAACDGDSATALEQLDRLFHSGENPLAIFGSICWTLRRFGAATRIVQRAERERRRISLSQALGEAGVPNWPTAMQKAERQLKQLGRERAAQFYRWLLETDVALKGSHSAPDQARLVLERLLVRMSRHAKVLSARTTAGQGARTGR